MKYDAIRSFLSRCEVLCEDIMDSQEEATSEGKFSTAIVTFYPIKCRLVLYSLRMKPFSLPLSPLGVFYGRDVSDQTFHTDAKHP